MIHVHNFFLCKNNKINTHNKLSSFLHAFVQIKCHLTGRTQHQRPQLAHGNNVLGHKYTTHTHTHTLTHSLTLTLTHTHTLKHSLSLSLSLTHTHTHTTNKRAHPQQLPVQEPYSTIRIHIFIHKDTSIRITYSYTHSYTHADEEVTSNPMTNACKRYLVHYA
jgi:hypothetical protein